MSNLQPKMEEITSPVTTPPLGIARITGFSFFNHNNFSASFFPASALSLKIMTIIFHLFLPNKLKTSQLQAVLPLQVFHVPQKDEWHQVQSPFFSQCLVCQMPFGSCLLQDNRFLPL